jgi:ABC-2 type transport system ATP-binding protein
VPTRRTGLLLALVLAALGALAPSASARDATVTSFDGTKIVTHFFPAANLPAGKKAPTVLVGHGYGMTGDTNPESTSSNLFGQVGLGPLRHAGYNVLTWDARGFGQSGGQVEVDSYQYEGRDVQSLIDYVARQPEAQLDRPGDPRLGMNGVSYGGGIQLITAGIDKRVDAITPTISWNNLLTSLYKQQVVKTGWGSILLGAGGTAVTGGATNPMGPETGNLDPQIVQAGTEGVATGHFSQQSVDFFASRGLPRLVDKIRAPTLLIQGTADTLFTLDEARRNQAILRANGVPVRMLWFCGGHGVCLTDQGPSDQITNAVLSWFARYLKGDTKAKTPPPFSYVAQDGKVRNGATYPPIESGGLEASGSGTLPLAPGAGNGALIAASPATDGYNLDLPTARNAFDVAGAPRLSLTYSGTGAPQDTYVYGQIVDTARNLVLGNVAQPIPVTLDGRPHSLAIPLEMIAYHGEPGAKLRLQIAPASSLYAPQRTAGALNLSRVSVRIPSVNLSAVPRLKVAVGPTRGMRKARRGRAFFLRVRAVGDRLSGVKVILRNRRGKRVGSTKAFTLAGKSRRVRVRVNRRVTAGRYRFSATATSPEGIAVKGSRRVRVHKARHHRR